MDRILLIETSTTLCSAAIMEEGQIVAYSEIDGRQHAAMLSSIIDQLLKENSLSVKDFNAIAVSMGPGSYTGLRVGVSTAKGLCFGAGIPLLACTSLDALAGQATDENYLPENCKYIIPMIDARRMEVYCAVYDNKGQRLSEIESKIIDTESFAEELSKGEVLFIGDGAAKCKDTLDHTNAHFVNVCPNAKGMSHAICDEYKEKRFKDVAYFEPLYLKEFVATVSKKKLF